MGLDHALHRRLRERAEQAAAAQAERQGDPQTFLAPKAATSEYRCPDTARLAVRQGSADLAANPTAITPVDADFVNLIDTEAALSWGRQISLTSLAAGRPRPFDARIRWTAGGGTGGVLHVTASGGGVVVFLEAATLKVDVANWHTSAQRVAVAVEEGIVSQTEALHKVHRDLALAAGGTVTLDVPPYARSVSVVPDKVSQRAGLNVELLDGAGVVIGVEVASVENALHVGTAEQVRLRNNNPGAVASVLTDFRLGWS